MGIHELNPRDLNWTLSGVVGSNHKKLSSRTLLNDGMPLIVLYACVALAIDDEWRNKQPHPE
jgi:hypothetical protein